MKLEQNIEAERRTDPQGQVQALVGRIPANTPQGVVALLVSDDGREIATATDFHHGKPGGFSQLEAQEIRAKEALSMAMMRALCSPRLSNAVDVYDAGRLMEKLCRNGCHVVIVPVGYEE